MSCGEVLFGSQLLLSNQRLAILISNLRYGIPITAFLDSDPKNPNSFETTLIASWATLPQKEKDNALHRILSLLRSEYAQYPPAFGHSPFIHSLSTGELRIKEQLDPRSLENSKPFTSVLISCESKHHELKIFPASDVSSCALSESSPRSWNSQLQLVTLSHDPKKQYIAKGPSASSDFSELQLLLALPAHPNIVPPPVGLLTVSETNDRVLGFLLEYYPLGNLDIYASQRHPVAPKKLFSWAKQIVDALCWLRTEHNTFHGDLKPDNIVVSTVNEEGEEELRLIDFSQDAFTAATCAPELREEWSLTVTSDGKLEWDMVAKQRDCGAATPVLKEWPIEAIDKAEVYSIGRTLHILAHGVPMTELYKCLYTDINHSFETKWEEGFGEGDELAGKLRSIVDWCCRRRPDERPTLEELKQEVKRWCSEKKNGGTKLSNLVDAVQKRGQKRTIKGSAEDGGLEDMHQSKRYCRIC